MQVPGSYWGLPWREKVIEICCWYAVFYYDTVQWAGRIILVNFFLTSPTVGVTENLFLEIYVFLAYICI